MLYFSALVEMASCKLSYPLSFLCVFPFVDLRVLVYGYATGLTPEDHLCTCIVCVCACVWVYECMHTTACMCVFLGRGMNDCNYIRRCEQSALSPTL